MNEFITWGSLFKLAITGVLIYAVQPLLLVGRDAVLWWAIDKYILNDELRTAVFELVSHEKMLANQPKNIDISAGRDGEAYIHDGIAVSSEQHTALMKQMQVCDQTLARIRPLVEARKRRLEWLLHHYKQPGKDNLIEDMISQRRAAQEAGRTITLQVGP
ncbi:hypothetical protein IPU70_00660 [Achromobacter sp. SD115]|uniref:hypothetical protein n=1 Tax=Achromobacter sp. SD115 TaxID=2782011 RepID=UPI001A977CD2|nr:hypothetical protein [Achromobacter sp. SD115]MBO1012038.1 hypothetical protein [Achromobacter sp. SD115]